MYDNTTECFFPLSGITRVPLLFTPHVIRCVGAGPISGPITMLLDTGTDPSAIDLALARRAGLPLGEFALGRGAVTNTIPYTETTIPWLRIGNLTIRTVSAIALDLQTLPFTVDIVLGYNVLCQIVLHIDYARSTIQLHHPDLGLPDASPYSATLPLTFLDHIPALADVKLHQPTPSIQYTQLPIATIDTGSNGGLTLSPDVAQRVGLHRESDGVTHALGSGFGGSCYVLRSYAKTIQFNHIMLNDVPLDSPEDGCGELSQQGRANIGNQLLSRFASVTLDYGRKLCLMEPI